MFIFKTILIFIHVLICVVLVVVILLQAARGGGLSGTFGGQASTTIFGPRGAASALSSLTQYLAAAFLILSLVLSLLAGAGQVTESVTQKVLESTPAATLPPVESLDFGTSGAPAGAAEPSEPFPGEGGQTDEP